MAIQTANEFAELVRSTRKRSKMTQRELAATSNTGIRFIRELENGKPSCQLDKALRVAHMLGIKFEAKLPPFENE